MGRVVLLRVRRMDVIEGGGMYVGTSRERHVGWGVAGGWLILSLMTLYVFCFSD